MLALRPGCENCDADLAMIDGAAHPAVIGTPEQVNKAIMDWARSDQAVTAVTGLGPASA